MKVKKEITVAIVIGLIISAIVIGGILRARRAISNLKLDIPKSSSTPYPSASVNPETGLFVVIDSPDNQVLTEPKLTLSGKTVSKAYIVINGEAGDYIIVASDTGKFSQEINLSKGANTIKITVYEENGNNTSTTINAVYSTSEI